MDRARQFHDMTTQELKDKFNNLKNELFNLRFQHSTGQLKNPIALNIVKKDIARVMTILKEREYGIVKNKGKAKAPAKKATENKEGGNK